MIFSAVQDDPRWSRVCAPGLMDGLWIALEGDLGAGKSSLVRTWLRAMGVEGRMPSPSYSLCEYYLPEGHAPVLHMDAYRLDPESDVHALGLDLYPKASLWIEWCSRLPELLLRCDVRIRIEIETDENTRRYALSAQSPRADRWIKAVETAFL